MAPAFWRSPAALDQAVRQTLDGRAGSGEPVAQALPILRLPDRKHGQEPARDGLVGGRLVSDPPLPGDVAEAFELATRSLRLARMIERRRLVAGRVGVGVA